MFAVGQLGVRGCNRRKASKDKIMSIVYCDILDDRPCTQSTCLTKQLSLYTVQISINIKKYFLCSLYQHFLFVK